MLEEIVAFVDASVDMAGKSDEANEGVHYFEHN